MSTATTATHAESARAPFLRSRLGSLLAFFPLSIWTCVHLWNNLSAFQGAEAWQQSVTGTGEQHPGSVLMTGIVVLLPLIVHTVWGLKRLGTTKPNNGSYGYYANFRYALQRLSAIGVMLFLGAHIWLAYLHPRLVEGHPEAFADIAGEMRHHGPTLIVYLLGTLGVSYHLANGLQTFAFGWGLATSRASLNSKFQWVSMLSFVALLAMAWGSIYALWSAGALVTGH
jgi:succinate dehydrogenase / fumarate reductase cytochrome b subunit